MDVKPVAFAFQQDWSRFRADGKECRLLPNFYWGSEFGDDPDFEPLYNQSAIDTLRARISDLEKANIAYAGEVFNLIGRAGNAERALALIAKSAMQEDA